MSSSRKWLAAALINALLLAGNAAQSHAFNVKDASRRVELESALASLPACEREVIDKRLKTVRFVNTIKFPEWADSYGFGLTLLSDSLHDALLERVFTHEMGHMFDWSIYPRPSETPEFEWAVTADFAAMPPKVAEENDYLRTPKEAFAELFSHHFLPLTYGQTPYVYRLDLMPQSQAAFTTELEAVCPASEGGRPVSSEP